MLAYAVLNNMLSGNAPQPGSGIQAAPHAAHRHLLYAGAALVGIATLSALWWLGNQHILSYRIGAQRINVQASPAEIEHAANQAMAAYRLQIQYPDGRIKAFPAGTIGLSADGGASAAASSKQLTWLSRLAWWRPVPLRLVVKADKSKLANFIAQNATVITSRPTDAKLTVSNGAASLAKAVPGKQYGLVDAAQTITARASALDNQPLRLTAQPLNPSVTQSNLVAAANKANRIINQKVAIKLGGQVITPSKADISGWLSLVPDTAAKTIDVTLNGAALHQYLAGLASKHYQVERDQVVMTQDDGSDVVAVAGRDGVAVGGQQAAEATISQQLLAGNDVTAELPVNIKAFNTVSAGNWPKWIEVNLTTDRMYVYQYAQLAQTFLVSAGKASTPTPTGTYYIWTKLTSQTMYGPGYIQPNVPWVNYFDHSGDAIHGVYWRPASVFGSYNTSHGCVGLQTADAAWVYRWAPIGTPVVIHR